MGLGNMLSGFYQSLRTAPESQYNTEGTAVTQIPEVEPALKAPPQVHIDEKSWPVHEQVAPVATTPSRPEEKRTVLDIVVDAAGSRWTLGITLLLLVAWGLWGAVSGPTDTWQVILQDVSSIQAYISATLLMRQQATQTRRVLSRLCSLISRSESNERMLRALSPKKRASFRLASRSMRSDIIDATQHKEDWLDKLSNKVAAAVGSLIFLGIYVAGIIVWAAMGPSLGFSDTWQLDVNTGTALEITFTTVFLQNIRRQHDKHLSAIIEGIEKVDKDVELHLRRLSGDTTPNPTIASIPATLSGWTRAIDIYAFIVGGYIGITISAVVFAIWIAVGEPLEFSDNWFLIIGTYTGLMGFVDGFIMKNVDHREAAMAKRHFERLEDKEYILFSLLDLDMPKTPEKTRLSLNERLSNAIGNWCGSTAASYTAVATVFLLIAIASAMQWTETGQLLANTPTMIIEGFLLVTLLQAHNGDDEKRRIMYNDILNRRLLLDATLSAMDDPAPEYVLPELEFREKAEVPAAVFPVAKSPEENKSAFRNTAAW